MNRNIHLALEICFVHVRRARPTHAQRHFFFFLCWAHFGLPFRSDATGPGRFVSLVPLSMHASGTRTHNRPKERDGSTRPPSLAAARASLRPRRAQHRRAVSVPYRSSPLHRCACVQANPNGSSGIQRNTHSQSASVFKRSKLA